MVANGVREFLDVTVDLPMAFANDDAGRGEGFNEVVHKGLKGRLERDAFVKRVIFSEVATIYLGSNSAIEASQPNRTTSFTFNRTPK